MNQHDQDTTHQDTNLDRLLDEVRSAVPGAERERAVLERVHARLRQEAGSPHQVLPLVTLADYAALFPAYFDGTLPPARRLLLEEEARRSVPLRRALAAARAARENEDVAAEHSGGAGTRGGGAAPAARRWQRYAVAAAVVLAAGLSAIVLAPELLPVRQAQAARVDGIDGTLFRVAGERLVAVAPGDWIDGGSELRTAKGSKAQIELRDGTRLELDERSAVVVRRRLGGDRVQVERGRILVEAAKQRAGRRLGVATEELAVAVKGTIFGVTHGTKGSRVAVVEGEVMVSHAGMRQALLSGEQFASRSSLSALPLEQHVAWSKNGDHYIAMLRELQQLRRDLDQLLTAEPRYSTRLLDLAPADAAVYVAVPNATAKLVEAYDLIRQRFATNPALAQAWQEFSGSSTDARVETLMGHLRELSQYLGAETVVAVGRAADGEWVPLVLTEVNDAQTFRSVLEQRLADLQELHQAEAEATGHDLPLRIVEQPAQADSHSLSIWLTGDLLVASSSPAALHRVEAALGGTATGGPSSELRSELVRAYAEGAQFLGAVDLHALLADEREELARVGLDNLRHVIVERRKDGELATTSATVSFDGERRGVAAWLAEPGPMAALRFFSPDATLVTALVVKDPAELFDEILALIASEGEDASEVLDRFESETGLSLRDDVLAALGGEVAVGLDGPALPQPAWKTVVEVYDPGQLQHAVATLVERLNQLARERGEAHSVTLDETQSGGRTFYTLSANAPADSPAAAIANAVEAHYTYIDGFLVVAPSRVLVERAISYWESGSSLVQSNQFRDLLPADAFADFSGVIYSRLGGMVGELLRKLPAGQNLTAEQQQAINELGTDEGGALYCVYGERDRIRFKSHGANSLPLGGLSEMLGLGGLLQGVSSSLPLGELLASGRAAEAERRAVSIDGGSEWR